MVSVAVEATPPRKHEVIEDVWFGPEGTGDGPYTFTAPPTGTVLSAYLLNQGSELQWFEVIAAKIEWLKEGFDPEDWEHFVERMADPTDVFDSNTMAAMHDALVAEVSARPFTSSKESTPRRARTTGGNVRKAKDATSGP